MSLTAQFVQASTAWVLQERLLETRAARPTDLAAVVAPTAPQRVLQDALRYSPQFFTPVDDMRSRVASTLSDPTGMNALFNVAIGGINRDLASIDGLLAELRDATQALGDGLVTPPPKQGASTIATRLTALEDVAARLDQASRSKMDSASPQDRSAFVADLILRLVGDEILNEDEVAAYVSANPVARQVLQSTRIQRVESLGDRYWRLVSAGEDTEDPTSLPSQQASISQAAGIELRDEQGRLVDALSGFESATLSPSGTLLVRGNGQGLPSGEIREFRIAPIEPAPESRFAASPALTTTAIGELTSARERLEEDLRFEVWGCLMLDLSERIDRLIGRIIAKINNIYYKVRSTLLAIVSGNFLQGLPTLEVNWQGAFARAVEATGLDLGDPLAAANTLVGVINNVGRIEVGGTQGVYCDLEQERYCTIHAALIDLKAELARLEQRANIRLSGQNLQDLAALLGWDPVAVRQVMESALAPLDDLVAGLEEGRAKMRGEVCAWVRGRLASTPPSVSALLAATVTAIALMGGIISAFGLGALGVPVDLRLIKEGLKLSAMGLTSMEESLENLDLAQVLGLSDEETTRAGKVARILDDAANKSGNIPRSQNLASLSSGVRDRDKQLTRHQAFRATMQARYHAPKGGMVAQAVAEQGAALCLEVDLEADSYRR